MIKTIVLLLLVITSCASLIGEEKSYTPAQKQFVCEFWETFIISTDALDIKSGKKTLAPGEKLKYPKTLVHGAIPSNFKRFRSILEWGDTKIKSKDCPKSFRRRWDIYSPNVIPALKTGFNSIFNGIPLSDDQKQYMDRINFAYKLLCESYEKCRSQVPRTKPVTSIDTLEDPLVKTAAVTNKTQTAVVTNKQETPPQICYDINHLVKHGRNQYISRNMDYETIKKCLLVFHKECTCKDVRSRFKNFFSPLTINEINELDKKPKAKKSYTYKGKGYSRYRRNNIRRQEEIPERALTSWQKKHIVLRNYGFIIRYIRREYNSNYSELKKKEKELIQFKQYNIPDYRCSWHVTMLAQKGSPVAQYALGFGATAISYTDYNCPSYLRWLSFAAEKGGYVPAFRVMGCAYANANTNEGFMKAIPFFREGFRRGDANCAWHIGDILVKAKIYDIALQWFVAGANKNHAACMERAAAIYAGEYGQKYVNIGNAIFYYEQCIEVEQRKNSMFNSIPLYQNKIRALRAKL